ncbi:carbohydrate ABC transporter permease [Anaerosporobacter sp.]|uniref:carbohydrate ABC transporter permease n=1 Tax=Anaerosporobacter sp. TaxID=1872529 RepID=UPI00286EE639|nr:carbohydrate ABC transporter permease [Anaerosporobacter sp.]
MSKKNVKKKQGWFFNKYEDKKDGVIRGYDVRSTKVKILCILIMILCFAFVLVSIFPVIWVFLASFKDIKEFTREVSILPKKFDFSKIKTTWNALKFQKYYMNSLISVAGSVVFAVIFNGLLAYGFAILRPKGYKVAFGLVMWSLLIPATTSIVAVFRNINMVGLSSSFLPLWLAFGANAFYVILFKEFFQEIPKELLEAAKLDGAGVLKVFSSIMIPLSKPIIMVVVIFAITAAWSDFLLPYLVLNGSGKETVMVKLFSFNDTPTDAVSVLRAALFAIIPPTILFAVFQKQITDGATAGAVKG